MPKQKYDEQGDRVRERSLISQMQSVRPDRLIKSETKQGPEDGLDG